MVNNNSNIETMLGEISSFWELTSNRSIEIPIIQRDYAQGRDDEGTRLVREQFVDDVLNHLRNNEPMKLHFVYGSLEEAVVEDEQRGAEIFTPLDGQQRLTLLFLVHWFIAIWNEHDLADFKSHVNGRFYYKTRESTKEFCAKLIDFTEKEAAELREKVRDGRYSEISLSRTLINEGWFHDSWQYDPSIMGMLVVIDTIKNLFGDSDVLGTAHRFFIALTNHEEDQHPLITFQLLFINRGDMHLTDELYIKMNSRGKPLTMFETFKAKFELMLRSYEMDKEFSKKIDHEWSDKFWTIRNRVVPQNKRENFSRDNTDSMMMNLIKVVIANSYAMLPDANDDVLNILFETQVAKSAKQDLKNFTFYRYSSDLGVFREEADSDDEQRTNAIKQNESICKEIIRAFMFIDDILDARGNVKENYAIPSSIKGIDHIIRRVLFYNIDAQSVYSDLSYGYRLYFHAYMVFWSAFREDICRDSKSKFMSRWMRFIRNMVESVEINNVRDMSKALKVVSNIVGDMKRCNEADINKYLDSLSVVAEKEKFEPFPETQMPEEMVKSWLICAGDRNGVDWRTSIEESDNIDSWLGRSGYLLRFSGVATKSRNVIVSLGADELAGKLLTFKGYLQKMRKVEEIMIEEARDHQGAHLLERALLCYGSYLRVIDDSLSCFMDQTVNGRTYSWRQMLQSNGIVNSDYVNGVDTLKCLLDDELFITGDVSVSLQNIINQRKTAITDWRFPIIDDSRLLNYPAKECMFIWPNTNDGVMIPTRRGGNSNRIQVWSYYYYGKLENMYAGRNVECPFKYYDKGDPYIYLYFKERKALLNESLNGGTEKSVSQSSDEDYECSLNFFTKDGSEWIAQISRLNVDTGKWEDLEVEDDKKLIAKVFGNITYPVTYKGDDVVSWIMSFNDRLNVGKE